MSDRSWAACPDNFCPNYAKSILGVGSSTSFFTPGLPFSLVSLLPSKLPHPMQPRSRPPFFLPSLSCGASLYPPWWLHPPHFTVVPSPAHRAGVALVGSLGQRPYSRPFASLSASPGNAQEFVRLAVLEVAMCLLATPKSHSLAGLLCTEAPG